LLVWGGNAHKTADGPLQGYLGILDDEIGKKKFGHGNIPWQEATARRTSFAKRRPVRLDEPGALTRRATPLPYYTLAKQYRSLSKIQMIV
jgi:hypothetical protein